MVDIDLSTPVGPAAARLSLPTRRHRPVGLLVCGHGAGGGIDAADLVATGAAALAEGWAVALLEQPYRVAGRRTPPPSARLDVAWSAAVGALRGRSELAGLPLVVGGRSSGARVACRCAAATGAAGVVALAFPLRPPGRPGVSRREELAAAGVPVLVVQGERDAFGGPAELLAAGLPGSVTVHGVAGADHAFRARRIDGRSSMECAAEAAAVVAGWLRRLPAQEPVGTT